MNMVIIDENLSYKLKRIIQGIVGSAVRVLHVDNLPLESPVKDKQIWAYAKEHKATVITKDKDFVDHVLFKGFPPKVIFVVAPNYKNDKLFELIASKSHLIYACVSDRTIEKYIEIREPKRFKPESIAVLLMEDIRYIEQQLGKPDYTEIVNPSRVGESPKAIYHFQEGILELVLINGDTDWVTFRPNYPIPYSPEALRQIGFVYTERPTIANDVVIHWKGQNHIFHNGEGFVHYFYLKARAQ